MAQKPPGKRALLTCVTSVWLPSGPSGPGWCKHLIGNSYYDVRHPHPGFELIQSTLTDPPPCFYLVHLSLPLPSWIQGALALDPWVPAPEIAQT